MPTIPWVTALLTVLGALAGLVFVQNYVGQILPDRRIVLAPSAMQPEGKAFVVPFDHSESDAGPNPRSRVVVLEGGRPLGPKERRVANTISHGGGSWTHEPGRIVFSASDDSDPRRNGRTYTAVSPRCYSRTYGVLSAIVVGACAWAVARRRRLIPAEPGQPAPPLSGRGFRGHVAAAGMVFALGLYLNTGTLAPYANTMANLVQRSTGYLYSIDHAHHRQVFALVDGQDRAQWENGILLRRVLFAAVSWPACKLLGFELGGFVTGFALNLLGWVLAVDFVRRETGQRAAVVAAWLLATYPGAAYWVGLPYSYALIFPASIFLVIALHRLDHAPGLRAVSGWSTALGVIYLGYDLAVFFLPATLFLLFWRRRWLAGAISVVMQLLPGALWSAWLVRGLGQSLHNSNTAVYTAVPRSYLHGGDLGAWVDRAVTALHAGLDVFFGANFLFLPLLFVAALLATGGRPVRLAAAEKALLAAGGMVWLILNLAPPYQGGWELRGTWIARLYQPIFPILVFFVARWWQDRPPAAAGPRRTLWIAGLTFALGGNLLIVSGPILRDPLGIAETAFYRFYDHTDHHSDFRQNLDTFGRRPLGFPRPVERGN